MINRIFWVFRLLCIGLTLAVLCAADDSNQVPASGTANSNQRPQVLRAKNPQTLQLAAFRQLLTEQPGGITSGTTSPADLGGMEKTLAGYQSAFEAMSLRQIFEVWPSLDRRHEAAFRGVFEFLRKTSSAPRLDLECAAPMAVGTTVRLECREALTYSREDRKLTTVGPLRVAIVLSKQSGDWIIQSMRGL